MIQPFLEKLRRGNSGLASLHPEIEYHVWPAVTSMIPKECFTTRLGFPALYQLHTQLVFAVATPSTVLLRLNEGKAVSFRPWFVRWYDKGRMSADVPGWWECGSEAGNKYRCLASYHAALGLDLRMTIPGTWRSLIKDRVAIISLSGRSADPQLTALEICRLFDLQREISGFHGVSRAILYVRDWIESGEVEKLQHDVHRRFSAIGVAVDFAGK